MKDNNFFKNKMAEEINKRIESAEWNSRIASAVLNKRKNNARKIYFTASASSLAAAAAIVLVLTGALNNKINGPVYDEFITAQIKGTYDSALPVKNKITAKKNQTADKKAVTAGNTTRVNEDAIFTEDIESLITDTLALR